jgi:putative ABC transport system substrate-binding protein
MSHAGTSILGRPAGGFAWADHAQAFRCVEGMKPGRRLILSAVLAAALPSAVGQTRPRRVGSLTLGSEAATAHFYDAFRSGMRELGWIEGRTVEYVFLFAAGRGDQLDALARELLRQDVEVVLVGPPQAARALQRATRTVPVVMSNVSNAVGNGFVQSLARPGGNFTGITAQNEVVLARLLQLLHQAVPAAERVALLLNPSNPSHAAFLHSAGEASASLGLRLLPVYADAPAALPAAMAAAQRDRAQAIVVVADAMFLSERARIGSLTRAAALPVAYALREHVAEGGLLSYSADIARNYRDAAQYVDKILRGANPADLPVAQPTRYELVLNLRTARALGLTMPQALLLQATEVIE